MIRFEEELWPTIKTLVRTLRVAARRSRMASTAAPHVKAPAAQLKSIATADTRNVVETFSLSAIRVFEVRGVLVTPFCFWRLGGSCQFEKLAREFGACAFILMFEKDVGVVPSLIPHAL